MQLLRLGPPGAERPAVLEGGVLYDLSPLTPDVDGDFLAGGGIARAREALRSGDLPELDGAGVRLGPPVARPGKIVCVGLNYQDHAEETGAPIPYEPVVFLKASNTVVGPDDRVLLPPGSRKTDWEAELAVVIGRTARYLVTDDEARACIAGYTISNDLTEREFQLERGGQWDKGKSCETFNPLGPWLVPADEVPDVQDLAVRLWVNGVLQQDGTTRHQIWGVARIVRYVSQFMVLDPGDVINTGTPAGVALGRPEPEPYLREGDVVELAVDRLGRQRQVIGRA